MAKKKAKNMVIVESPAKAKTINKYLGPDFAVQASLGHVRDLPKKELGIDIEDDFKPKYVILKDKGTPKLRKAAKAAKAVFLAPDPDREGEAIAWHLVQALDIPPEKVRRVSFNEITERAVKEAFENPRPIDMHKVHAQQARRILDRIVGYKLSPLLWKKITKGLSAGRVQSVAVRLIVERDQEVQAFVIQEYWTIAAVFQESESEQSDQPAKFIATLKSRDGKDFQPKSETEATEVVRAVEGKAFEVITVQQREVKSHPVPPFATSQLQQSASTRLGFTAARTMRTAQALYQGEVEIGGEGAGLITYMRTDSFRVAGEAIGAVRQWIQDRYGSEYLPEKPNAYKSRSRSQDAHECIRPTDVRRDPESLRQYLSSEQFRLYDLIWRRFVASQMTPGRFLATTVDLTCGPYIFRATGRVPLFDGHLKLTGRSFRELDRITDRDAEKGDEPDDPASDERPDKSKTGTPARRKVEGDQRLPKLETGRTLTPERIEPDQHFTKPPPHYTEASLVKTLEREGIGRPSTYAHIIRTIQDRGYVNKEGRSLVATELGTLVTQKLLGHFSSIMDYKFTSQMEDELDKIEEASIDWVQVLKNFYKPFDADLVKAAEEMESIKGEAARTEYKCDKCGATMLKKFSRYGAFLGCEKYPECKQTMPLGPDGKPQKPEDSLVGVICDECGGQMALKRGRFGQFLGCANYPECKNTMRIARDGSYIKRTKQPPADPICKCDKCRKDMIVRAARRGGRLFIGCTGYPRCRNTHKLPLPPEAQPLREYNEQEKAYMAEAERAAADKAAGKAAKQESTAADKPKPKAAGKKKAKAAGKKKAKKKSAARVPVPDSKVS